MKAALFLLAALFSQLAWGVAATKTGTAADRAKELKDYLKKEKPAFDSRETQRKDALEELDKLNAEQNQTRERMAAILASQEELTMALDNLNIEALKQKQLEHTERQRLLLLLKIVYKIRKDGMLRFLVSGEDLGHMTGRVRILFRALRLHSEVTRQLGERTLRLAEGERKLASARNELHHLLEELKEQQDVLGQFLERKRTLIREINRKQGHFQAAVKEYREVAKQLATLFDNFESLRDTDPYLGGVTVFPNRASLPLPIGAGTIVSQFGRSVHKSFKTVTYRKGIEIEAELSSPVKAVLPGIVEFEGWVKGLGNVVILHHGNGF